MRGYDSRWDDRKLTQAQISRGEKKESWLDSLVIHNATKRKECVADKLLRNNTCQSCTSGDGHHHKVATLELKAGQ